MNDILTTLVAFVGFLIVFSMFLQSVQETLKNLLKLRSGVWERFFVNLYREKLAPSSTAGSEAAPDLVSQGFWERFRHGEFVGEYDTRMRGLAQFVAKGHRATRTLQRTLRAIDELDPQSAEFPATLQELLGAFLEETREVTALKLDAFLKWFDKANNGAVTTLYAKIQAISSELPTSKTSAAGADWQKLHRGCGDLLSYLDSIEKSRYEYKVQIENKVESWIVQVNAEYKRNMLKWTVCIGALFVLVFNADSFSIYRYFLTQSGKEVAVQEAALKSMDVVQSVKASELNDILDRLRAGELGAAEDSLTAAARRLASDFEQIRRMDLAEQAQGLVSPPATPPGHTLEEGGERLLRDRLGQLSGLYATLQGETLGYRLETLQGLGVPLGWTRDWRAIVSAPGRSRVLLVLKKLGGLALTTFLITFGAPFWNDLLGALVGVQRMTKKPA